MVGIFYLSDPYLLLFTYSLHVKVFSEIHVFESEMHLNAKRKLSMNKSAPTIFACDNTTY